MDQLYIAKKETNESVPLWGDAKQKRLFFHKELRKILFLTETMRTVPFVCETEQPA